MAYYGMGTVKASVFEGKLPVKWSGLCMQGCQTGIELINTRHDVTVKSSSSLKSKVTISDSIGETMETWPLQLINNNNISIIREKIKTYYVEKQMSQNMS